MSINLWKKLNKVNHPDIFAGGPSHHFDIKFTSYDKSTWLCKHRHCNHLWVYQRPGDGEPKQELGKSVLGRVGFPAQVGIVILLEEMQINGAN